MPSTPAIKLGLRRSSYNRVSYEKELKEGRRNSYIYDTEPLQDDKQTQQNGGLAAEDGTEYINFGMEDQMEVEGFVRDKLKTVITWVMIMVSCGALRLVFHWCPHWMLYATHRHSSLQIAEKVLVIERYQQKHKCYYVKSIKIITVNSARESLNEDEEWDESSLIELKKLDAMKLPVHSSNGRFTEYESVRLFKCKKMTYVWNSDGCEFVKLRGLDHNMNTSALHSLKELSAVQQFLRRAVYGCNEISVPMRSITALLFLEVLNPFYIFQLFSVCLWMSDDYEYYATCILIMSIASIVTAVYQTRKNQLNLWSRVYSRDVATVLREGVGEVTIPTEHLVPGDVLVVPSQGCTMYCDAVLLTGNCIVNESMLTGESVPVTKTPVPSTPSDYNEKEHSRHTLFSGTHVIQTRYYGQERVRAVVLRTSFNTAKGNLVRSILYPPPVDFKFERDSYKFVQMLAFVAACGVIYTVVSKFMRGNSAKDIALEALDLITIVVPPALPAAMTVGRIYAQSRLKKAHIFCISPRSINVSGSINCICFDKTGTLTEDGLDMWGVVAGDGAKWSLPTHDVSSLDQSAPLLHAMVTCHSLTLIDGSLTGDPLDLKMFESTGWLLEEPEVSDDTKFDLISPTVVRPANSSPSKRSTSTEEEMTIEGLEIGIVRQFPFSSSLQRMSVVTRRLGENHFTVYCKGSPEMITSLCNPDTVPEDFEEELEGYTREGYRVLALAWKPLPAKVSYHKLQRVAREEAESQLVFLGLVVLENRLKPQTKGALATIAAAHIRTIMVTGDNMLTALSVARDCGIVPHGHDVILVKTVSTPGEPTSLCFTLQAYHAPPHAQELNEKSTYINSIESYPNGTVKNSIIVDLPIDSTYEMEKSGWKYVFALTGQTWSILREQFPDVMARIATRGAVFARMSPDNKQQLVLELQSIGYYVAMVGDGANDCGALKAAHAGISLSEAESSVASPFTSKDPNIQCIIEVVREGRAALVTSFSIFKYMAAYSLMQFVSVVILYSMDSNLTDVEFLYIDLFIITVFAFVLGRIESLKGPLHNRPPQSSLLSFVPIVSLVGQMGIVVALQGFAFYYSRAQLWYTPPNGTVHEVKEGDVPAGFENFSVFSVSSLQYIVLALVFSQGRPYRQNPLTSRLLVGTTLVITAFTVYLIVWPCAWLVDQFLLSVPPDVNFRLVMVALGAFNVFLALGYELFVTYAHKCWKRARKGEGCIYMVLEREMSGDREWPPLSGSPGEDRRPPQPGTLPPYPPRVTLVSSPSLNNNNKAQRVVSETELDELKFSTPMRSNISLGERTSKHQSEDNLSKYATPLSTPGPSPIHHVP